MSYDYPRSTMSRATKMRAASQASERDGNPAAMMMQQQLPTNRTTQQQQHQAVLAGSVAILWDMENCPVPSEVRADDVAGNIRMALRLHPVIQGAVTFFSAYGDFNHFPRKVREGCHRTGVNLIDVPNGKKDASDKAILADLFIFALDNAPPCTIFLISGDVDFAPALHKLWQRGYTVVLAIPSGVGVSAALRSAGRYVWDWPCVARGGGLVPAKNFTSRSSGGEERMAEIIEMNASAGQPGPVWSHDDDSDLASDDQPYEDEHIVWSPAPPRPIDQSLIDSSAGPKWDTTSQLQQQQQRNSGSSSTHSSWGSGKSPPFAFYPPAPPREQSGTQQPSGAARETVAVARDTLRVQSDATGSSVVKGSSKNGTTPAENVQAERSLRDQLVKLLSLNGQKMELGRVPFEYQKQFGKPLFSGDGGHSRTKLLNLLERLREWLFMRGDGATRTLHLTKTGSRVAAKLKREAKNARSAPKEEVEVNLINFIDSDVKVQGKDVGDDDYEEAKNARGAPKEEMEVDLINFNDSDAKIPGKDVGDDDYETAGEEVVIGFARKGIQSRIVGVKDSRPKSEGGEHNSSKELEDIHPPRYDWGFGSMGSGGSGGERDSSLQEEAKDVEIDESTLEQVGKTGKGNNNNSRQPAGGWDILDAFRWELQDLLVSFACKVPMTSLLELYQQRYSKPLEYAKFGVKDLESLVEKVSDVASITEMDVKDLESGMEKVSDVAEVFMEDKKTKLKVLVAHRIDVGGASEKRTESDGGAQEL